MRLGDYIKAEITTKAPMKDFGARLGASEASISRYVSGSIIPRRNMMVLIFVATGGKVTPNDFYELPDLSDLPMGQAAEAA